MSDGILQAGYLCASSAHPWHTRDRLTGKLEKDDGALRRQGQKQDGEQTQIQEERTSDEHVYFKEHRLFECEWLRMLRVKGGGS